MLSLGDIARPLKVEDTKVTAESNSQAVDTSPAPEKLPALSTPANIEGKDNWSTLKIKLNNYGTRAPLIAAALNGSTGLSTKDVIGRIGELTKFHKDISTAIAGELWPAENVPPSALAVIGKSVGRNAIDLWDYNKTNPTDPMTVKKAAEMFVAMMPAIDLETEEVFDQQDQIALPVLREASVGAAISAKLIKCLQEYPEPVKALYLGNKSIPDIALALTKDALSRSKEISSTITVHKNLTVQDSKHKEVAYQSTLKTLGSLYESSIEMASSQIKAKLIEVKSQGKDAQNAYIAMIQEFPQGQLYDNVEKKVNALVSIVYTQQAASKQQTPSVKMEEESSISPRR